MGENGKHGIREEECKTSKTSMEVEEWRRLHHLEERNSMISDEESRHLKHLAKTQNLDTKKITHAEFHYSIY